MITNLDHKSTDFSNSMIIEGFKKDKWFYFDDILVEEDNLTLMPEIDEWEYISNKEKLIKELNNRDDLL
ncbi:hypothetical protein [uncultured Tissierella sp.]|uniref:hypothetical protein n=1 Tax=uncultured Tissierella sp. TaxID=448160 RepID=UPI0028042181|nr:hypothetical protein [uncultured Tissierella sp.]MDU5080534.1 hypothetical protein [Bacillota bacterium]